MGTWRMLVIGFMIFVGTEAIAWIILFNKDLKAIAQRIRESHQHFTAIKNNIIQIKDHVSDVAEYVVKGEHTQEQTTNEPSKETTETQQ